MDNILEKSFINKQLGIKFISFIGSKCKVWFKAKQVAQILNYKDTDDAIRKHITENHKRKFLLSQPGQSPGQVQSRWIIFIDEAGFYELVFRSKLPSAKIFREWVFAKVLPSVRKYGYYKIFESKIKQRVIFNGVKFYRHPVFGSYAASKNGEILSLKTEKILKITENGKGYLKFTLCDKKLKKPINYKQHRFVYEVFKGLIPKCLEIDHVNNIKTDNGIKNLQLLNHKQNVQKSKSKPIISINIENGKEKRYISIRSASIELDINAGNISQICRKSVKQLNLKKMEKIYI